MPKKSAGLLIYRLHHQSLEILLVHPGGPFWQNKDLNAWSIPKGEFNDDEEPLNAAKREALEEIGIPVDGKFIPLTPVKQKSGKIIYAWAVNADIDLSGFHSNTFEMEWPPKSGVLKVIPEVDRADWFTIKEVEKKLIAGQLPFIHELQKILAQ